METYKCRLRTRWKCRLGGHSELSRLVEVTATRMVELPFVPFTGLRIDLAKHDEDDDTGEDALATFRTYAIYWVVRYGHFVLEQSEPFELPFRDENELTVCFEDAGWTVTLPE